MTEWSKSPYLQQLLKHKARAEKEGREGKREERREEKNGGGRDKKDHCVIKHYKGQDTNSTSQ